MSIFSLLLVQIYTLKLYQTREVFDYVHHPIKTEFSKRNSLFLICVVRVWIETKHFLYEKKTLRGIFKDIKLILINQKSTTYILLKLILKNWKLYEIVSNFLYFKDALVNGNPLFCLNDFNFSYFLQRINQLDWMK